MLKEAGTIVVGGKIAGLLENKSLQRAAKGSFETVVHGTGVLDGAGIGAVGLGCFDVNQINVTVVLEEIFGGDGEDAGVASNVPFDLFGADPKGDQKRRERVSSAVPGGGEGSTGGGEGLGAST